jgi:multidrug efflux pump subunit AcrB
VNLSKITLCAYVPYPFVPLKKTTMLTKIIDRPVLATVISIVIVVLGFVGLDRLSVTRFPDISPPTVMVSGSYPGVTAKL